MTYDRLSMIAAELDRLATPMHDSSIDTGGSDTDWALDDDGGAADDLADVLAGLGAPVAVTERVC